MNKEEVLEYIVRYHIQILVGLIVVLQIITLVKVNNMEKMYVHIDNKITDTQSILGVSNAPDTGKPMLKNNINQPAEKTKVLLPIKPDNDTDIAYIEKGYLGTENYYPTDTPLIYHVSDPLITAGTNYSKKLVNIGWQILDMKKGGGAGADYLQSFSATNGSSVFEVQILGELASYTKKVQGGSFVQIILKK